MVTDAAGNQRPRRPSPSRVDSTGPSVSLADPGAVVGGTISLTATTGGGAARVVFAVSPAGAGTWTQIANDTIGPFGTPLDTSTLPDGLYDLRAVGYDALGNASAPVAPHGRPLRQHGTGPRLRRRPQTARSRRPPTRSC